MLEQKEKQTIQTNIGYEIEITRMSEEDVIRKLAEFEARNGMSSSEFIRKWNHGGLQGDCREHVDWAGYCQLASEFGFEENECIFRYDNADHHRGLPNFPHHKHEGPDERVSGCPQPTSHAIRGEIEAYLSAD